MPFSRPTLTELRADGLADIDAAFLSEEGRLRFSLAAVLSEALQGAVNGCYGYLDWIARQCTPFTATDEWLEAWAGLKGITRKPATPAAGTLVFVAEAGAVLPAGTPVIRVGGFSFTTSAEATESSGLITVEASAITAGAADNTAASTPFTLGSAIPGVQANGTASLEFTGGADLELDEDLRSRMLQAYAAPTRGGTKTDFEFWALAVAGVTRAWAEPNGMGAGTVIIRFMMDRVNAGTGGYPAGVDGVSTYEYRISTKATLDLLRVADAVFLEQPAIATVYVVAPQSNVVTFSLSGLATATTAVKTAIVGVVADVFYNFGSPGGTIDLSTIESAIASVAGSEGFIIEAIACADGSVSSGGVGNVTSDPGFLPTAGTFTWL